MNANPSPLVSVLMTAYNREKYIHEAIESVLASSYTHFELIIVDDCSTDNTVAIARSYEAKDSRIKVFRNEKNLGDYNNRNQAARFASGKYFKYVDSDDLIYPYGLEVMVNAMEQFPGAALGITSRNVIPFTPFPILLTPLEAYRKHFFEYGFLDYGPTGVIILAYVFKENGMFSGRRFVGDKQCWFKIANMYSVVELPPSLTFWRQHEEQEMKIEEKAIQNGDLLMNFQLVNEVLSNPDCPLNEYEKEIIIRRQRRIYSRVLIKHLLKTGEIKKVFRTFTESQLSIRDLF
ncbi:MAG TPA: glycosyltransferase family 2 protein [Puia sp.]|nr:glycosyltransferase family 2 protein [Puia sp.]